MRTTLIALAATLVVGLGETCAAMNDVELQKLIARKKCQKLP